MSEATRIKIGSWIANPALNVLESGDRSIRLESRAMDVLAYLAARPSDVVSLEELLASVWKGVVVSDASVYNTIKQLRQALAGSGDDTRYIETIPKRGYRLVAPVERLGPAPVAVTATPLPAPRADNAMRLPATQRRGLRVWLASAALAVLLATALSIAWLRSDPEPRSPGAAQASVAPPIRFALPIDSGLIGLAVSPDGRYVAYAAGPTLSSGVLYVRPLDALEARELPGTTGAVFPFWSPKSDEIGFVAQGRIKRMALAGGAPQDLAAAPVFTIGSWNGDDVILFDNSTGIARVPASGGPPAKATTLNAARGEVAHALPWFLPGGRRFLFVSAFGEPGVYVGSLDSDERTQVLPFSAWTTFASGHLLFNRGATLFAQRFDPDTLTLHGEPVRVADGLITDPTGSIAMYAVAESVLAYATGDLMLDQRDPRTSRLAWYDRSGKRLETIGEPGLYRGIELSPDGSKIAVHRHDNTVGGNLWLYDLVRGTFTRLTFGAAHDTWPAWSPEGDRLIFTGANLNLLEKRTNGIGEERLVLDSARFGFVSDWSADGTTLLITHMPANDNDVSAFRLDGEQAQTPLLRTKFNESGAMLSPDGRWLAYASDESGRFEVYVSSYPQISDKVQLSTAGGVLPRWSTSGREVFFVTQEGALMTVPVTPGAALSPGLPRELFKTDIVILDHWSLTGQLWHMPYDVSPDGERFLINEFVGEAPSDPLPTPRTTIVVVPNWAAALPR
jgi:DNA-binding winged helix-turn-helix (wHTH) protein/Tol biopolymer transport system component